MAGAYTAIRDYAVIGDGRTAALVALDGSIDWLCLPNLDSPSVFAALLDAERGGRFELRPEGPFEARRRYLAGTNVLETTFTTATGVVRVTDAMTLPGPGLVPLRELARRIEGLAGEVTLRWRVVPRFGYGIGTTRIEPRRPFPLALSGTDVLAACAWDAGSVSVAGGELGGQFQIAEGRRALLVLCASHGEPLVIPGRAAVEERLDRTIAFWQRWSSNLTYDGPWRDAVVRSALALRTLVFAPSGAIAAAVTTSLPEALGGERNWDYRFCWIRDSSFTLEALLQLGCHDEATSFFWWFMHATRLTIPQLQVFYRLDGGAYAPERALPLEGYRGSRPVRTGNGAASQLQLDTFGDLMDTAWLYADKGFHLDRDTAANLARVADFVGHHWCDRDAGIWEVRAAPRHHTHSKAMCWVALDRAVRLAERGQLPRRHLRWWRAEALRIRAFIDTHCWSEDKQSYVWYAGSRDLDAALLLLSIMRYAEPNDPRLRATVRAVERELTRGALVYRYTGDDGMVSGEGAFLCCSFWLAEALALEGRRDDAAAIMETVVGLANDVGLYAEEVDPSSHEFLGNFPQALVHLALISTALAMNRRGA